ncbi:MAG: Crp/Fnr family transcriptional regulator [Chloroflexi bacterium]|nr:Crp/Fnr family transcriptional regulator [Chloroflexota bacterium]
MSATAEPHDGSLTGAESPTGVPACAMQVPFLRILPPEALAELGRAMRHRHYQKGARLAVAGDPVLYLVVVARGRLNAVQSVAGGREQVVRSLGPGEFVGELGLFAPVRHESDLVVSQSADVCLVPRQAIQEILDRYPEAATRLVEALARRLADAERAIGDLALRDVSQRLAAELLRLSETGMAVADGIRVRMPMPWVEAAALLGTTPESLSRRLKALAEQGVIRQERVRTIVIREPERLRELAEG